MQILAAILNVAGLEWAVSPHLRDRTQTFVSEYQEYKTKNLANSIGLRLEYWRKSLQFIAEPPL